MFQFQPVPNVSSCGKRFSSLCSTFSGGTNILMIAKDKNLIQIIISSISSACLLVWTRKSKSKFWSVGARFLSEAQAMSPAFFSGQGRRRRAIIVVPPPPTWTMPPSPPLLTTILGAIGGNGFVGRHSTGVRTLPTPPP